MGFKDSFNAVQIRALLWKDVLVRARQPLMTIIQYLWPILIFISLYTVRNRFQPQELDTCQFPTRQLPSKGELLPFFQSYICTIENECLKPDENFAEISKFEKAPITPLLHVVKTILNEPDLYGAIVELPEHLDFVTTIITIATHGKFPSIQENIGEFVKLLPELRKVIGEKFDVTQLFADSRVFSNTGNILCGRPFPRSDNIRYVDRMLYSQDFNGANQDELDAMPTPYCKQLYLDVTNSNNGKITWTLLKPVIQGKILYGPTSLMNDKIIKNANQTFEEMLHLRNFFSALNQTIVRIRTEPDVQKDFLSLVELASSPMVTSIIGEGGAGAVNELLNGILHDETVLSMVQVIVNILTCFSVDRFVPVYSEKELEQRALALDNKKLFFAAVYFDNPNINTKDISYKLRMITDNTPITLENRNRFWFPGPDGSFEFDLRYHRGFIQIQNAIDMAIIRTKKNDTFDHFSPQEQELLKNVDDDEDFSVTFDPFAEIEKDSNSSDEPKTEEEADPFGDLVDQIKTTAENNEKAFDNLFDKLDKVTSTSSTTTTTTTLAPEVEKNETKEEIPEGEPKSRKKRQFSGLLSLLLGNNEMKNSMKIQVDESQYYTKQFSYPKYVKDDFKNGLYLAQSVQMAFFFALIVHVALAARQRIWMKESGNSSLMRAMGLTSLSEHISWWFINFIELAFVFFVALVILYIGGILVTTNKIFVFIFLMIFGVCLLAFCYMCSTFFSSASIGSVTTVILFLITFLPYIVIISLGTTLSGSSRFMSNLFFATPFCGCWRFLMRLELQNIPVSFSKAFEGTTIENDFKYGFWMIVLDFFIYLVIGYLYEKYKNAETSFYNVPVKDMDSKTGAIMENASKYYDTDKLAVSHVSITFLRDQITCLLGRNGAGKSTIIKMLTGQVYPSSGKVTIGNHRNELGNSGHVGLCCQNNILIPNLTAKEHLNLYAAIKMNSSQSAEVDRILSELHLEKYERYRVQELSGGYQRRLSIALAFLGSPNLVILDEPCSGVDTRARKNIWELIGTLKKGRAVILATHYLDEAEHLSDNILILNNGKVIAEASPQNLKNELTKNFTINANLIKSFSDLNNELEDEIQTELEKIASNSKFDIHGNELKITINYAENKDKLGDIIELFENFQRAKKISGLKVTNKNLEDIFNQLNRINNPNQVSGLIYKHYQKNQNGTKHSTNGKYPHYNGHSELKPEKKNSEKWPEIFKVILLLFWKRLTHFQRNYRLLITILILPAVFEIIAMSFMKLRPPDDFGKSLKFSPNLYPESNQFFSFEGENQLTNSSLNILLKNNDHCVHNNSELCTRFNSSEDANDWILETYDKYQESRYAGVSFNNSKMVVWYNNKGYHSMPMELNELNSALFKAELNDNSFSISTTNHPLKLGDKELSTSSVLQQVADAGISLIILVAFSLVVAGNSIYIVNERISGEKLQQKLCGINFKVYWGVTFAWDFIIYLIAMLLAVIIFWLYSIPVYVDKSNLDGICLILFLYGFAMIPAVHVFEKLFPDASIANMTIFCLNIITALTTITVIILFDVLGDTKESEKARDFLNGLFLIFPQHALSDGLIQICTNHIKSQIFQMYYIDTYKHPVTSDLIRSNYIALFLLGLFFMVLNFLIESEFLGNYFRSSKFFKKCKLHENDLQIVSIQNSQKNGSVNKEPENVLTVEGLTKSYRKGSYALENVSFHVKSGECVGLLGANGAGKSTIFGILSGQIKPCSGHIKMVNATDTDYIDISYVPQTNAIDNLLTVSEVMTFYGKLRRVTDIGALVKKALHAYHLDTYKHFLVKNLSGGNKRKLSVAVACFGKTNLVLMDEPTSDMDPVTRTLVYKSINELIFEHRSVILTSHSISEIENVCDRIAVLKSGHLISMGTPSELKQICGNSYLVTVFYDKIEGLTIERDIQNEFPTAENLIGHSHSLQFVIKLAIKEQEQESEEQIAEHGLTLSDLFRKLQTFCLERSIVFTVSQCLLDRAFEQLHDNEAASFTNSAFILKDTET